MRASTHILTARDVDVEVTYKAVKHLRMRVTGAEGLVRVSAPRGVAMKEVRDFVEANAAWIDRARGKVMARAHSPTPLTDGGRVKLWGQWRDVRVREAPRPSVRLADGVIHLAASSEDGLRRALDELYGKELAPIADEMIRRWEPRVGRRASRVRLRRMTSRWGSCNAATASITLNLALAERDPDCLEYVIVHELVHLLVAGHGPRFKAEMSRLLPSWPERRRALKEAP